jgi:hypothetical protein
MTEAPSQQHKFFVNEPRYKFGLFLLEWDLIYRTRVAAVAAELISSKTSRSENYFHTLPIHHLDSIFTYLHARALDVARAKNIPQALWTL